MKIEVLTQLLFGKTVIGTVHGLDIEPFNKHIFCTRIYFDKSNLREAIARFHSCECPYCPYNPRMPVFRSLEQMMTDESFYISYKNQDGGDVIYQIFIEHYDKLHDFNELFYVQNVQLSFVK